MDSLAFVFPGQGSQSIGMLGDFTNNNQIVIDTFDEASEILAIDVKQLISNGPEELLNRTDYTQPVLLASSVALFRLWKKESNNMPILLAGHSLGEYSALVCAGSIQFADALRLVKKRGELMMQAVPAGIGAMAAILGMEQEEVITACLEITSEDNSKETVQAVNFNSPGQVVIAGHRNAVSATMELCKANGAKRAMPIAVSVPSHCSLMIPAAEQLKVTLQSITIKKPQIPVINNVDVAIVDTDENIIDALVRQLYSPVRWIETIQLMQQKNITQIIECGPGKILSGLTKRIDRSFSSLMTLDRNNFNKTLGVLNSNE
jgi:[acyl-carrier-protein] S-malonyltransferase